MKRYVHSSYDPSVADLYVVKIWYEIDPGHDVAAPQAAEEIVTVVAGSPSEALERAKQQWSGPIDRIEIVDINPEEDVDVDIPFEASTDIKADNNYFGVGGHFKHYVKTLARQDAEDGQIIMTLNQFKGVIEEDNFEDLDEDEIEEGFSLYQDLVDKYANEIDASTCVKASDDYDDMDPLDALYAAEDDGLLDIEEQVFEDLGLYCDFSSCRMDAGTVFIYSDPNHECMSDMWDGDDDAEITSVDYGDYVDYLVNNIINKPEDKWYGLFKKYMESLIK